MMRFGSLACGLILLLGGMCGSGFSRADDSETPLPKISEMQLPEAETLLRQKPVDWVVLKNDDTLVVETVSPRPNTLAKLEAELKALASVKPKDKDELEELRERRLSLQKLQVSLPGGGEDQDFLIETNKIKEIIYHEDHVLQRAGKCIDEGLTATAFELLVYLDRRHHNWPGYERQSRRLLLKEAQVRLDQNDPEAALRFIDELYTKEKDFAGLADVAGQAVDRLVQASVEQQEYRKGRYYLGRLTIHAPEHPVAQKWKAELTARTTSQIAEARAAASRNELSQAAHLIEQAARIWPDTPGLRDAHRELIHRYPILTVGVLHLPTEETLYPFQTWAQLRSSQLTTLNWFETRSYDSNGPRYYSAPCESWDPDDLGRELRFILRRDRADWETRPRLTSATLAAALQERLDPASTEYNERLASYISQISTPSPFELHVRFRRPPLRPEAYFRIPLTAAAEVPDLNADLNEDPTSLEQRFHLIPEETGQCRYVRVRTEPEIVKQRHVAEIVERPYDNWDHLLQGLLRGEISAIDRIAHRDLVGLRDDPRFFVLPYSQPVSHVIQFNPQSQPMQNGQVRRALLHALPREEILLAQILDGASASQSWGRLSTSPFTIGGAAHNPLLPQPEHEPILSAGLAATARRELQGAIPPLKITFPPDDEIRRAVEAMIVQWKRVGIEVVPTTTKDEEWDLAYRTVQFREPLIDLWPFLTIDPTTSVEGLTVFPERIRRQLMEMERSADWATAIRVLHRLQTDLLVDAWWIPLWELDEYCLVRRNVSGLPEQLVNPYQAVDRWVVQPWYPTEQP